MKNVSEETSARGRKRRSRVSRVRKMVLAGAFVLFCIGVVAVGGMGDACRVGYEAIAMVCPLGALEGFFGSWSFVPRMALGLVLALAVVLIAGRAFCSGICAAPARLSSHQEAAATRCGRAQGPGRGLLGVVEELLLRMQRRLLRGCMCAGQWG